MVSEEAANEPDLRDYLDVLRRRKWTIALSVAVFLGGALAASSLQKPAYAGTAKLLLKPHSSPSLFGNKPQSDVDGVRFVLTEIEVLETDPGVQKLVHERIGSLPPVQVLPVGQTDFVTVRAESTDPTRAPLVANAYANAYIDIRRTQALNELSVASEEVQARITDIEAQLGNLGSTASDPTTCVDPSRTPEACSGPPTADPRVGARRTTLVSQLTTLQQRLDQLQLDIALVTGGAQLVAPASTPSEPFKPTPRRNALVAVVLGLLVGAALAFLVDYLDNSRKGDR